MENEISVSEYARQVGRSHTAVQKAISTGKITTGFNSVTKKIIPLIADQEWGDEQKIIRPKAGVSRQKIAEKLQLQSQVAAATEELQPEVATVIPADRLNHLSPDDRNLIIKYTAAHFEYFENDFEDLVQPDDDDISIISRRHLHSYMLIENAKLQSTDIAKVFGWKAKQIEGWHRSMSVRDSLYRAFSRHFSAIQALVDNNNINHH